jgi:hypothetical protein
MRLIAGVIPHSLLIALPTPREPALLIDSLLDFRSHRSKNAVGQSRTEIVYPALMVVQKKAVAAANEVFAFAPFECFRTRIRSKYAVDDLVAFHLLYSSQCFPQRSFGFLRQAYHEKRFRRNLVPSYDFAGLDHES